jgi:hypothetical protein
MVKHENKHTNKLKKKNKNTHNTNKLDKHESLINTTTKKNIILFKKRDAKIIHYKDKMIKEPSIPLTHQNPRQHPNKLYQVPALRKLKTNLLQNRKFPPSLSLSHRKVELHI